MSKLALAAGALVGIGLLAKRQAPELQRYLNVRKM